MSEEPASITETPTLPAEQAVSTTPEVVEAAPEGTETPKPPEPVEPPIPKGVQKRIDRAVRQKYEAEARARMLEERLERLERSSQSPQQARQPADEVPTIDKFSNLEDYVAAKAEYVATRKIQDALTEREQRQQAEKQQQSQAQVAAEWQSRLVKATAELPDFEEVIGASDVPMTPAMQEAIMSSDVGPKLAYWLASNPDEAVKIVNLSPVAQIRALGRIEERLEKGQAPAPQVSKAPEPIRPVGTKASASRDPDSMTTEEWLKWRNAQLKK